MPINKEKGGEISNAFNPNIKKDKKPKEKTPIADFFKGLFKGGSAAEALSKGQKQRHGKKDKK